MSTKEFLRQQGSICTNPHFTIENLNLAIKYDDRNFVPVSVVEIFAERPWPRATEKRMTRPTTPTATASASDGGPEMKRN